MHKNTTKCNKTLRKWCKNKHGASKIIDTFETYQLVRHLVSAVAMSVSSNGTAITAENDEKRASWGECCCGKVCNSRHNREPRA
jgi:hypothetical protein